MRWFKGSIRNSIYGLLGNPVAPIVAGKQLGKIAQLEDALLASEVERQVDEPFRGPGPTGG